MTTCEAMKLLSNSISNQEVILCKYSDIDWTIYRPKRAGIIVYTYANNDFYFAFGLDRKHNELTDFGGGVKQADMFSDLSALRELREESLNIFDYITRQHLQNSYAMCSTDMMILLVYQDVNPQKICEEYNKRKVLVNPNDLENSAIVWISSEQFFDIAKSKPLSLLVFKKVMYFFRDCRNDLLTVFKPYLDSIIRPTAGSP